MATYAVSCEVAVVKERVCYAVLPEVPRSVFGFAVRRYIHNRRSKSAL